MLTCKDVCDNATDHLEGATTFGERVSLRLHLLMCKECRKFYRQFQIAVGVSTKLESVPEPTDEEIDELLVKLKARTEQAAD